jgi:hypothetical protein
VISDKEAKLLLKGDDELILAVYDYWIDKRLRLKQSLIPTVKSDKRDLVRKVDQFLQISNIFLFGKVRYLFAAEERLGDKTSIQCKPHNVITDTVIVWLM